MKRRDFLKLSGFMSLVAYVMSGPAIQLLGLPVETKAFGKIYRGSRNGNIHISEDEGKTWSLQTNFGPDYPILDMFTGADDQLYLQVAFKQYTFPLVLSQDKKDWLFLLS